MGMMVALLLVHLLPQSPTVAQPQHMQTGNYQVSAMAFATKDGTTKCAYIIDTQTGQYFFTTKDSGYFER
jgi:hypothetical protein